jgi:hypothetical protein
MGVPPGGMDLVGLVTVGNFVAKPLDLRPVGDIGDVRRFLAPIQIWPLAYLSAGGGEQCGSDVS